MKKSIDSKKFKVCSKCGKRKHISEFHRTGNNHLRSDCKDCKNEYNRIYQKKHYLKSKQNKNIENQNFKVGDEVFDILIQEKGVVGLVLGSALIKVEYKNLIKTYYMSGKSYEADKFPILLHYNEDYNYNIIDFNNLPQRQEPKKWRAEKGKNYYCIGKVGDVNSTDIFYACCIEYDNDDDFDISNYNKGNYFQTKEQAQQVAYKMNAYFKLI